MQELQVEFPDLEEQIDNMVKLVSEKNQKEKKKEETVNHPTHYLNTEDRPDMIEYIEEFEMIYGTEATMWACLFNMGKYRDRAADKNGLNDLRKSDWYAQKFKELKKKLKGNSTITLNDLAVPDIKLLGGML